MDSTYSLLSALKGQQRQMDAVANNLANVNTPGFKQDQVMFKEYYNRMVGQDLESEEEQFTHGDFSSPYSRGTSSYVFADHVSPLMHKGDFRATNNPYDLAIQTDGFFVVDTVQGPRYTRNGQFIRDGQGFLITTNGDQVLGKKGPIKIDGEDFSVGSDGRILVDKEEVDQFRIVVFEQPSMLTKLGNSYWAPGSNRQKPIEFDNMVIQQGTIEGSNVDSIQELVKMITVNRSYEAAQKAMRAKDELSEKSITIARV
jgi:flagellar basal-body rod protein FlgG